jgi:DNA-binding NtrC family response regulator
MTNRILCIDDEPAILRSFSRLMARMEVDVDLAETAAAAVDFANKHDYAVIVTDYRLPERNGIELARALRDLQPRATYILVSGASDADLVREATRDGIIDRIITKPWGVQEMRDNFVQALEEYQQRCR